MGEPVNAGAGSGGSDRLGTIQARVDELGSLYRKAMAARSANRTARIVVVVAIVVVVIVFGLSLYSFARNYPKDKFIAEIQSQSLPVMAQMKEKAGAMAKDLAPVYLEELKKSWPDVKVKAEQELSAFKDQLKAEWPAVQNELTAFQKDIAAQWPNVQDQLRGELDTLVKELQAELPAIRKQIEDQAGMFRDQFQKDWPGMQAKLEEQADLFVKNVQEKANQLMMTRIEGLMKRQQDKVWAAFPDLKDDQKRAVVLQNLQTGFQAAVKNVMSNRMANGKDRIARLYAKILNFLPPDRRAEFPQRITTAWDVLLKKYQSAQPLP